MSFSEKFKFALRKLAISLKRNYFMIPMLIIGVTILVIMCSLSTVSTIITRAAGSNAYAAIYEFCVCLLTILGGVAYINYAFVGYGKKRPLIMMIIFLVLYAGSTVLLFLIYNGIRPSIVDDINAYNNAIASGNEIDAAAYQDFAVNGAKTLRLLITHIVLCIVSMVLVITAPFIQNCLKKIKFAAISKEEKASNDTDIEEIVEEK